MSGEVIARIIILIMGVIFISSVLLLKWRSCMEKEPMFEIFMDKKKKFRFRLKAPNGEIICQSEGYESKQACVDTIAVLGGYARQAKTVDLTLT